MFMVLRIVTSRKTVKVYAENNVREPMLMAGHCIVIMTPENHVCEKLLASSVYMALQTWFLLHDYGIIYTMEFV